ncbi:nucleolar protein [Coemansia pectinata]|uniref:Nucleolar protein n=1 Tax=Coemansia pectinata TaxID=1052879 RepID=A0A9W8H1E5_9FUNG|nr:nucleolar protein [Coemansia pectinata]
MAPGRKPAAKGKAAPAPKSTPAKSKAAPAAATKKSAPVKKSTPVKKSAPVKTPAKRPEPESESEEQDDDEEVEETIYEEMSDDSAVEEASGSEVEDDQEEEEAAAEEESTDVVRLEEDSDDSESEIDEDALLAGIKGSESDASESEVEEDVFRSGQGKIDIDGKASSIIRARLDKLKKSKGKPGVVYIGRIPHGFYEEQMMGYFKQFGTIKRLRLSRNPKTGRSRHFAFIEFAHHEVARIVAETMNNYLMFERLLKCVVVPEDKVHPQLFVNRNAKIVPGQRQRAHQAVHNRQRTQEEVESQVNRLVAKESKKRTKLQAAGIDYDFQGYKGVRPPKAKHVKYDDTE